MHQRGLRALAQLQRENVGAVQDTGARQFECPHVGERQRNRPRVASHVRARARLVEIELAIRAEGDLVGARAADGAGQVDDRILHDLQAAAAASRLRVTPSRSPRRRSIRASG